MNDFYVLDDDNETPRRVDLLTWASSLESHKRKIVQQTYLDRRGNEVAADCSYWLFLVSTVFLGMDHGFSFGAASWLC